MFYVGKINFDSEFWFSSTVGFCSAGLRSRCIRHFTLTYRCVLWEAPLSQLEKLQYNVFRITSCPFRVI